MTLFLFWTILNTPDIVKSESCVLQDQRPCGTYSQALFTPRYVNATALGCIPWDIQNNENSRSENRRPNQDQKKLKSRTNSTDDILFLGSGLVRFGPRTMTEPFGLGPTGFGPRIFRSFIYCRLGGLLMVISHIEVF